MSNVYIFRSPVTIILPYVFVICLKEILSSLKNTLFLVESGLYPNITHHLFLDIVNSEQAFKMTPFLL